MELNTKTLGQRPGTSSSYYMNILKWAVRKFFLFAAMLLALFPSVIKMYETSHWFREGDPSIYDNAKDWFSNPAIPFQAHFDSSKVLMRIYFFIVPYFLSAVCVAIALAVPSVKSSPSTTVLGNHIKKQRRMIGSFLRVSLAFPSFLVRIGLPQNISVGELFGVIIFLILNIMTMGVRVRRSLPRGSRKITFLVDSDEDASKEAIETYSWQACEIWAKTLGVISIVNLGWYLLMPIGRKSVLLEALGLSWERAVKYHRWVGFYSVAIMVIHSFLYVAIWIHGDGNPNYDPDSKMISSNLVPWYCSENECDEDQARMLRINMYGFVTLLLILTMTAFALPAIRRLRFELFYYVHHLFILVLLFVCLHYKGSIIYIIPGIAMYSVDKVMALYSYRKTAPVATRMLSIDVLEVSFNTKPGVQYKAGDYVFLNVPSVSHLQWHPFSLTSAPTAHGNEVFFHLKAVGTWTEQVIEEARKQDDGLLQVRLDGFYGVNNGVCDQFRQKDGVIVVGGGIGVTPMISLAIEMCKTSSIPVTLMWVVRTIDEFSIFSEELANAQHLHDNFTAKAWITMSAPEPIISADEEKGTGGNTINKSDLLKLDSFDQATSVIRHLTSIKALRDPKDNSSPIYALGVSSLTGAFNAFIMATSIFLATVAFAWSTKIANTDSYADTIQDHISLMDLSLVCAFVLVCILMVIFMRTSRWLPHQKDIPMMPRYKAVHALNNSSTIESTRTLSQKSFSVKSWNSIKLENNQGNNEEELQFMIEGNIGCRPSIPEEFSSIARAVVKSRSMGNNENNQGPADIAVLACGPPKLVESINDYVNTPSFSSASSGAKRNNQAIFSFTEEDWEW